MARRVNLPTADDLFRPTTTRDAGARRVRAVPDAPAAEPAPAGAGDEDASSGADPSAGDAAGQKKPSGRIRHDEKMTVYVTSEELLEIEHARLGLRGRHGLAVDRGRLVREALSLVLADFEAQGDDSALVRRLTEG